MSADFFSGYKALCDGLKNRISTLYGHLPPLIRLMFIPAGVILNWLREACGQLYMMWKRQDPDSNENRQVDQNVAKMFFSKPNEVRCNVYIYTKRLSNSAIKLVNEISSGLLADQNSVSHWAIVVEYLLDDGTKVFALYESGQYNENQDPRLNVSMFTHNVKLETLKNNNYIKEMCVGETRVNPVEVQKFCQEFTDRELVYDRYKMNCQNFVKEFIGSYVPASQVPWNEIRYDAEVANRLGAASKVASSGTIASASVSV